MPERTDVLEQTNENSLWYLYLIRDRDNRLYTGVTTNVTRRFQQHCAGKGARNLRGRMPLVLYCAFTIGTKPEAMSAEYRLKRWPKAHKEQLPFTPHLQQRLWESAGIMTSTCSPKIYI